MIAIHRKSPRTGRGEIRSKVAEGENDHRVSPLNKRCQCRFDIRMRFLERCEFRSNFPECENERRTEEQCPTSTLIAYACVLRTAQVTGWR